MKCNIKCINTNIKTLTIFIILTLLLLLTSCFGTDAFYEVVQNINIANTGNGNANNLKISINIGQDYFTPYSKIEYKKIEPNPNSYETDEYGNTFALYEIDKLAANSDMNFKITRVIKTGTSTPRLNLSQNYSFDLGNEPEWLINPQNGISSDEPAMIAKTNEIAKPNDKKVDKLKKFFSYVNLNMTYDTNTDYANQGSLCALNTLRGVCEEYATLLTALCRAQGIPARTIIGYRLDDDTSSILSQGNLVPSEQNSHAWVEVYTPELGYVPIEPTFAYTVNDVKVVYMDGLNNVDTSNYIPTGLYNLDKNTVDLSYTYLGSMPDVKATIDKGSTIRKVNSSYVLNEPTFMYNTQIAEPTPVPSKNIFQIIFDALTIIFTSVTNMFSELFQ